MAQKLKKKNQNYFLHFLEINISFICIVFTFFLFLFSFFAENFSKHPNNIFINSIFPKKKFSHSIIYIYIYI